MASAAELKQLLGKTADTSAAQLKALVQKTNVSGEQEKPDVGFVEGLVGAINQGLTFGFNDEVSAAITAAVQKLSNPEGSFSDAYKADVEANRGRLDAFRSEHPNIATGAEVTGAIPSALVPLGAVGRAIQGGNVFTRVVGGAGLGAAGGGLYGAGSGESGKKLESAELGAALGGAAGAFAPAAGAGVRALVSRTGTGGAAKQANMPRAAHGILTRAAQADESLYGPGAQRIRAAGPDAMLADAGPNTQALLDVAVQKSGPAGTVARRALESRASKSGRDVSAALDEALGVPGKALPEPKGKLNALYDKAYAQPIDYSSESGGSIEQNYLTRVPSGAIKAANELMRVEGVPASKQIMATIADDGTITFERMPDVRQIDYITRGLNEVADKANSKGKLGGTTQIGRAYANLSRELRNSLKESVPEYREALNAAAGLIRERKAKEFGEELLRPRMSRDDVSEMLSDMGNAELSKAGEGVRTYIDDALANIKRALTDDNMDAREAVKAVKDLSSRAARDKLSMLLGPEKAAKLFDELDRASKAFELRAGVAQNSKTFARTALADAIREQTEGGVVNALRSGEPIGAARRLTQAIGGRTPAAKERISDEVYSALVKALTGPRGESAAELLNRMQVAQALTGAQSKHYARLTQLLLQRAAPATEQVRQRLQP